MLAELGVEIGNKMAAPGSASVPAASVAAGASGGEAVAMAGGGSPGGEDLDAELQRRLDSLRRT